MMRSRSRSSSSPRAASAAGDSVVGGAARSREVPRLDSRPRASKQRARSITALSSRTLPGHGCPRGARSARRRQLRAARAAAALRLVEERAAPAARSAGAARAAAASQRDAVETEIEIAARNCAARRPPPAGRGWSPRRSARRSRCGERRRRAHLAASRSRAAAWPAASAAARRPRRGTRCRRPPTRAGPACLRWRR